MRRRLNISAALTEASLGEGGDIFLMRLAVEQAEANRALLICWWGGCWAYEFRAVGAEINPEEADGGTYGEYVGVHFERGTDYQAGRILADASGCAESYLPSNLLQKAKHLSLTCSARRFR